MVEQQSAGDRADHDADAGGRGPDGYRPAALPGAEQRHDDREGGGHDERGAQAHQRAERHELPGRVGQGGGRGGQGEHRQAPGQGAAVPEPGAEAARGDQHRGEHQGVGVVDPLKVGGGGGQCLGERGQGRVEHGVVDGGHDQGQAERRQGGPSARVARLGVGQVLGAHDLPMSSCS